MPAVLSVAADAGGQVPDAALADWLSAARLAAAGRSACQAGGCLQPAPTLRVGAVAGHVNMALSLDGAARRLPLALAGAPPLPSAPLAAAAARAGATPVLRPGVLDLGGVRVATGAGGMVFLGHHGGVGALPSVSLSARLGRRGT